MVKGDPSGSTRRPSRASAAVRPCGRDLPRARAAFAAGDLRVISSSAATDPERRSAHPHVSGRLPAPTRRRPCTGGRRAGGELRSRRTGRARDALQLSGFADPGSACFFGAAARRLRRRPKGARDRLGLTAADLRRAIPLDDTARFEAIPGHRQEGPRSGLCSNQGEAGALERSHRYEAPPRARDALVELGYSVTDAEAASASVDPEAFAEERVRLA